MKIRILLSAVFALVLGTVLVNAAQAPASVPAKPDSPRVKAHIEAARQAAGDDWAEAFAFWCHPDQRMVNRADDPVMIPTQVFDNLYVIGRTSTWVFVVRTSEGLILIDAGYQNDVENVLLAGMKTLNLDPATIKHVIVTHAHADHFGGAKTLQDRYGATVWLAAADWDLLERPAQPGRGGAPVPAPKRDMTVVDRQPIRLGDTTVTPVALAGHTPGTIALIVGVKDGRRSHVAGILGAPMLIPPPDPQVDQHIRSLEQFGSVARQMKVDVGLLNHPLMDGASTRLARLQTRKPGRPHPFVVGINDYQRFLNVSTECLRSVLARRADAKIEKS